MFVITSLHFIIRHTLKQICGVLVPVPGITQQQTFYLIHWLDW